MARDCSCAQCIAACKRCPGKFAPGEAEKAAELIGVPFSEFKKRLIKNYDTDPSDPMFWEPRKVDVPGAEVASDWYTNIRGRCVFLTADEKCEIHAAKPYECRSALLCEGNMPSVLPELNRLWAANPMKENE